MGEKKVCLFVPYGNYLYFCIRFSEGRTAVRHPSTTQMDNKGRVLMWISSRDWESVAQMLRGLSNMEFRRMERVMREEVLTELPNELFWETLLHLIIYKRAAFLSGVTAVEHLVCDGSLDFGVEAVQGLYGHLKATHSESLVKLCNMMMPLLKTERQVTGMFEALHIEPEVKRLSILLKDDSPLSYFLIFKTLKMAEDKTVARKCCMVLTKRQDDRAFNAACLIKTYFGLDDLPGRFSLKIEQYELSHIDRDFETFQHVLSGKRPRV